VVQGAEVDGGLTVIANAPTLPSATQAASDPSARSRDTGRRRRSIRRLAAGHPGRVDAEAQIHPQGGLGQPEPVPWDVLDSLALAPRSASVGWAPHALPTAVAPRETASLVSTALFRNRAMTWRQAQGRALAGAAVHRGAELHRSVRTAPDFVRPAKRWRARASSGPVFRVAESRRGSGRTAVVRVTQASLARRYLMGGVVD
jgi:hypothetical protein